MSPRVEKACRTLDALLSRVPIAAWMTLFAFLFLMRVMLGERP